MLSKFIGEFVIHVYCPAKPIARAETYKTDELISFPQIVVAEIFSLIFLLI